MGLTRHWYPTGYYSSGGSKRLLVIHTMEGFTGPNGAKDCVIYFQGNVGVSSHVCIDNNRGHIWEGVARTNSSWTQCNYNGAAISCEQSGYASWSRDYWLTNREPQLRNIADWLKEESAKTGIPLVLLNSSQAQGSGRGVCYHSHLGSSGCGHSDPGSNWPWDKVLEWAKGGGSPAATGGVLVSSATEFYDGKRYFAYIRTDGKVCMNGGVVDAGSNAKSGVGLAINPENGQKVITYTNTSNKLCTYTQNAGDNKWYWDNTDLDAK